MSFGSLNAGPEKVTPKGEVFGWKFGSALSMLALFKLGKNPAGTMTLGYPARAGGVAPKLAGNRTASNFLPLQIPWSASGPSHSFSTAPVKRPTRPQDLLCLSQ